jgi:hypothetical protein
MVIVPRGHTSAQSPQPEHNSRSIVVVTFSSIQSHFYQFLGEKLSAKQAENKIILNVPFIHDGISLG